MKEELLDKYLSGRITSEELEDLRASGENLEDLDALKSGIRLSALEGKLDMLKEFEVQMQEDETSGAKIIAQTWRFLKNRRSILSLAAGFALLIAAISLFKYNNKADLYADNYAFYPALGISRGVEEVSNYEKALSTYNAKQFEAAIAELTAFSDINDSFFFLALSFMQMEQFPEAIVNLELYLKKSVDDEFKLPANYYLGLIYLKLENIERAIKYLSKVQKGSYGYDNAQRILDAIQ
jgi:TolA-binding protein